MIPIDRLHCWLILAPFRTDPICCVFVIEDIFQAVKKDDYGLRTLIVEALASEIFRSR